MMPDFFGVSPLDQQDIPDEVRMSIGGTIFNAAIVDILLSFGRRRMCLPIDNSLGLIRHRR